MKTWHSDNIPAIRTFSMKLNKFKYKKGFAIQKEIPVYNK